MEDTIQAKADDVAIRLLAELLAVEGVAAALMGLP